MEGEYGELALIILIMFHFAPAAQKKERRLS
jgi:hypothetical protein